MKQSSGVILLSFTIIVSLMAGTYILMRDWNIGGTFGYIAAVGLAIAAVLYAGSPNRSFAAVVSMLAGALYIFWRSTGAINFPLLKYVLGLGMIGYGIFGLFALFKIINKQGDSRG